MYYAHFYILDDSASETSLLQRLASASLGRSDADGVDPSTGALRMRMQNVKEAKTAQNVEVAKKSEWHFEINWLFIVMTIVTEF